jgi:alkyl hydroperoxide reductase subunit AhpF
MAGVIRERNVGLVRRVHSNLSSTETPSVPNRGLATPGRNLWEVLIVGGGLAGLSAGIYLGRALRKALIIDNGGSLALWEPEVQNYLGFPQGISGEELLERGRQQAQAYGVVFVEDTIQSAAGLFPADRGGGARKRPGPLAGFRGRGPICGRFHLYDARRYLQ